MKTMWAAAKKQQFVTREELPRLLRIALAEIIVGQKIELPDETSAQQAVFEPPFVPPPKKKTRRAQGHTHRGICGQACFDGTRRADGTWRFKRQ